MSRYVTAEDFAVATRGPRAGSLRGRLLAYFESNPDKTLTIDETVEMFDVAHQTAVNVLNKAVSQGEIGFEPRPYKDPRYSTRYRKAGPTAAKRIDYLSLKEPLAAPLDWRAPKK